MIDIVPITPRNAMLFRTVRLAALQESPWAFGSTFARESQFADDEWNQRVARWSGETGIGFLAMDGDIACGIAGGLLHEEDAARAALVSMWTAPDHRRRGVGRLLVNEIARWATGRGARVLQLAVTSANESAMVFYESLGFRRTGRTEPYPNDPALIEYEMERALP